MLASVPLFVEYEAVLKRAEHLLAAGVSAGDVDAVLDVLARLLILVETHFLWRPRLRDANDEMVLETAVNGRAATIVTFNMRDYLPVARVFGVEVLRPGEAVRRISE
jgi:predicted nucleic acid-binding protein